MYHITDYTYRKAFLLGVEVKPSTHLKKKIDVFQDGKKIASIGDPSYGDYPTYLKEKGKAFAEERRKLYHLRHTKNTLGEKLARDLLW